MDIHTNSTISTSHNAFTASRPLDSTTAQNQNAAPLRSTTAEPKSNNNEQTQATPPNTANNSQTQRINAFERVANLKVPPQEPSARVSPLGNEAIELKPLVVEAKTSNRANAFVAVANFEEEFHIIDTFA